MSLAERISNLNQTGPGLPCGIGKLLTQLSDVDKEALIAVFNANPYPNGVSNRLIFKILSEEGYNVAFASVRLHRAKNCRCFIGKDSPHRIAISKNNTSIKSGAKKK